jgi:SAM-dependent methyltransferase
MNMMNEGSHDAAAHNARTISMYEGYARNYALLIEPRPRPDRRRWLDRLCAEVGSGARVLELGSGTGRDADHLESVGVRVRRTDATQAFVDLQTEGGARAEVLNAIHDDLVAAGAPGYDAVLALCVLIHVDRPLVPAVLAKIRAALRPNGVFLVSVREGENDEVSASCFTSCWRPGSFEQLVIEADLCIEETGRHVDGDGDVWRTMLCRRDA